MAPRWTALLFVFLPGLLASNYRIEGHADFISAEDVRNTSVLGMHTSLVQNELRSALNDDAINFVLETFEVHSGSKVESAIFVGYFNCLHERAQLLELIQQSNKLTVFHLAPIDSIPVLESANTNTLMMSPCVNGGWFMPNRTCSCANYYSGQFCEVVQCLHYGIQDGGVCACPPGINTQNCQASCSPSPINKLDNSKQSFILVLNQKSTMFYALNTLIGEIPMLVSNLSSNNPGMIQNYILVNYVDGTNKHYMQTNFFTDRQKFLNYLSNVNIVDGNSMQPTNRAVLKALSFAPQTKGFSNVFIFADSPDSEATSANYSISSDSMDAQVIGIANAWRHRLVYVFCQSPNSPVDVSLDSWVVFERIAANTMGDVISIDQSEVKKVLNALSNYGYNENIFVRYASAKDAVIEWQADFVNQPLFILLTVQPNGTFPSLSTNGWGVPTPTGKLWKFSGYQYTQGPKNWNITGGSPWNIRIFVASKTTAIVSYSDDPVVDIGTSHTTTSTNLFSSVIALGSKLNFTVTAIELQSGDLIPYNVNTTERTSECTFPVLLSYGNYTCKPGAFGQRIMFSNETSSIIRLIPGFCGIIDNAAPEPFVCLNGGTPATGMNFCFCATGFDGSNCQDRACQNFGYTNPFPGNGNPQCICQAGFQGDYCDEAVGCLAASHEVFDKKNKSLVIIIQNSMSQVMNNAKINLGVSTLLAQLPPDFQFAEFIITTFNAITQNGQFTPVVNITKFYDYVSFQQALDTDSTLYTASQYPSEDAMAAIVATVNAVDYDYSPMFFFTDKPAINSDVTGKRRAISKLTEKQLQVNIVITSPFGMPDLCMSSYDSSLYAEVARKSGGNYINLCNKYGHYQKDPIVGVFEAYGLVTGMETVDSKDNVNGGFYLSDARHYESYPIYMVLNGYYFENFTVSFTPKNEQKYYLTAINSMPFLSVYLLPTPGTDLNWYNLDVTGITHGSENFATMRVLQKSPVSFYMAYTTEVDIDSTSKHYPYGPGVYAVSHFPVETVHNDSTLELAVVTNGDAFSYLDFTVQRPVCSYTFQSNFMMACALDDYFMFGLQLIAPDRTYVSRFVRAYCFTEPGTACFNGGTLSANGSCTCPDLYRGDFCENPICLNGFISNSQCRCSNGYTGEHCELMYCDMQNFRAINDPRLNAFRQITFIININKDQLLANIFVMNALQQFLNSSSYHSSMMLSLVAFDDKNVIDVITTTKTDEFLYAFNLTTRNFNPTIAVETMSLEAVKEAIKLIMQPTGIVFLITGQNVASSSASDTLFMNQIVGTQVNVIYTPQNVQYPGIPGGEGADQLIQLVKTTGGKTIPATQYGLQGLPSLLASSMDITSIVLDSGSEDCSSSASFTFYIERDYNYLQFVISGSGMEVAGSISLTFNNDNKIHIDNSSIVFADESTVVYRLESATVTNGTWTVNIKTLSGSCYVQVRTFSAINVLTGFTDNLHSDYPSDVMFIGYGSNRSTYMTFNLVDNANTTTTTLSTLNYMIIYSIFPLQPWKNEQLQNVSIAARARNECNSQFISALWTVSNSSTYLKTVVHGTDQYNNSFQRTFFFTLPNILEKPQTCQNGYRTQMGWCNCDAQHEGVYCRDRICQNGGTSTYEVCECPDGFYGEFCEKYNQ